MKYGKFICVTCLFTVLAAFVTMDRDKLIALLDSYTVLNQQYAEAFQQQDNHRQQKILKKLNRMDRDKFLPALPDIENLFCDSGDRKLLNAYVNMLESIGHSASEAPRYSFGKMYLCHPDMVLEAVRESESRRQVAGDLQFGFESVIYDVDTSGIDVSILREKIKITE